MGVDRVTGKALDIDPAPFEVGRLGEQLRPGAGALAPSDDVVTDVNQVPFSRI